MKILLAACAVFGLAFVGMALGVLLGGRGIKGSCGGLSQLQDEQGNSLCEACERPSIVCRVKQRWRVEGGGSRATR